MTPITRPANPEALFERALLRHIGELQRSTYPNLIVLKNECGVGYHGRVRDAVRAALAPFGAAAQDAAAAAMVRCRVAFGLGVGSPDLVGAVNGRVLAVELKSDRGRLSPEQLQWHAAAERRGVAVGTARTLEEFDALVDAAARNPVRSA